MQVCIVTHDACTVRGARSLQGWRTVHARPGEPCAMSHASMRNIARKPVRRAFARHTCTHVCAYLHGRKYARLAHDTCTVGVMLRDPGDCDLLERGAARVGWAVHIAQRCMHGNITWQCIDASMHTEPEHVEMWWKLNRQHWPADALVRICPALVMLH